MQKNYPGLPGDGDMNETYTFSRALHAMRYCGSAMKPYNMELDLFLFVEDEVLMIYCEGYSCPLDESNHFICGEDIMGSWVEVK